MILAHISDLHLGKSLHNFSMLDDQEYILNHIIEKLVEKKVDVLLIAGDVYDKNVAPDATIFFTNDLSLANIANLFFGEDSIYSVNPNDVDFYKGYTTINMSDEEMSNFYQHLDVPVEEHYINDYYYEYFKPKVMLETSLNLNRTSFWNHYKFSYFKNKEFYVLGTNLNLKTDTCLYTLKEI